MAHCKPKRISRISRSSKWFRYLSKISDTLINLPRLFQRIKGNIIVKVNDLTWLSTISSARISFMVHPPPMRNEIFLPTIRKQGEMRVPWGGSALSWYSLPAGSFSLGRFSAPPHPPVPLLLGAFPVACCWIVTKYWLVNESCASHFPSPIPSSKSRLQAGEKERRRNVYPAECSMTIIRYYKLHFTAQCLPLLQYAPVIPEGHLQRNPLSVYPAWQVPLFQQGLLPQGFC